MKLLLNLRMPIWVLLVTLSINAGKAWAQESAAAERHPLGALFTFFPVIALFVIFYFLILRPQQQANKKREAMITGVKRGDRVLTSGGLYGTVIGVRGDSLDLKVSDNVKVEINRHYVARVIAGSDGSVPAPPAEAKK